MGKSEQTRKLIVDTALRLFREVGYEQTTMRAIAGAAGVSVGNAYYYFPSKDDLIQELYRSIQIEHRDAVEHDLLAGGTLTERLRTAIHAGLDVMAPHHGFGTAFVTTAIRPDSPTSPFSAESADTRAMAISIFSDVVYGAKPKVSEKIREELPELLWLAYMGAILFWVNDSSPHQQRTRVLVNGSVPLIGQLVRLAKVPGAGGILEDIVKLMGTVKS